MNMVLLICALSTAPQDCDLGTALRHFDLPMHPVVCTSAAVQFLAENADMWNEHTEYPAITCQQGYKA